MNFSMMIIALLFLALFIFVIGRDIYSKFDHSYLPPLPLKPDARIISIQSEKVVYVKNGAKYKTKVLFSDGFAFITHKTNREDGFLTYKISVDNALATEISKRALAAHEKAYQKQIKQ